MLMLRFGWMNICRMIQHQVRGCDPDICPFVIVIKVKQCFYHLSDGSEL